MANKYANEITAALSKLDPQNNEHWTDDGLPVTRVVQTLANEPGIKRSDINEVAPGFSRTTSEPVEETAAGEVAAPTVADEGAGLGIDAEEGSKEALKAEYEAAEQKLAQSRADRIAATRAENDAQKLRDKALTKLNAAFPPLSHAQNIQQYIRHETEERARKLGHLGPSQLDAAMSARRSRGWSRPKIGQTVAR